MELTLGRVEKAAEGVDEGEVEILAPLTFALMAGLPVALLLWLARRQDRRRTGQRGFEPAARARGTDAGADATPATCVTAKRD